MDRFVIKNGKIYEHGIELSVRALDAYIKRQQQAIEENKNIGGGLGELGRQANELLKPELDQAIRIRGQFPSVTPYPLAPPLRDLVR